MQDFGQRVGVCKPLKFTPAEWVGLTAARCPLLHEATLKGARSSLKYVHRRLFLVHTSLLLLIFHFYPVHFWSRPSAFSQRENNPGYRLSLIPENGNSASNALVVLGAL